jgi:hypothetical protein
MYSLTAKATSKWEISAHFGAFQTHQGFGGDAAMQTVRVCKSVYVGLYRTAYMRNKPVYDIRTWDVPTI